MHLQQLIMGQNKDRIQPLLPVEATAALKRVFQKKHQSLRKRWRVNRYASFVPFLQVPIWLTLMETVRAMCGNTRGLLPYVFPFLVADPANAGIMGSHLATEPTFATEGAFWFPSLLAGDPTGVLPVLLSASILTNVLSGWKTHRLTDLWDLPRMELIRALAMKTFKGFVVLLAIRIGISAYVAGMPAGLLIYWIASTTTASLQTLFLDKFVFADKPTKPWRQMHIGILRPGEVKDENDRF
jgi:inner membrane protein COX18